MEGQKEQNGRTGQKEHVRLEFESCSKNEEFARVVAAVFMSRLDPNIRGDTGCKNSSVRGSHQCHYPWLWKRRWRDIFRYDG